MKRILSLMAAFAAFASISSCTQDAIPETDGTHYVVINTGEANLTKTVISPSGAGYEVAWQEGDMIDLFEIVPTLKNYVQRYQSEPLAASDINPDGSASFRVALLDERAGEPAYQYVAIAPGTAKGLGYCYVDKETSSPVISIDFNSVQMPREGSFDPAADVMVSKIISSSSQLAGDASMEFSRVGAILRLTLKGLNSYAGWGIQSLVFSTGESYGIGGSAVYNAADEQVEYTYGKNLTMCPNVAVKEDGTAEIWIRAFAGTITDWFSVTLDLANDKKECASIYKKVDLASEGKTLVIAEGSYKPFSVIAPWSAVPQMSLNAEYGFVATSDPGSFDITVNTNLTMDDITFSCDNPSVTFNKSDIVSGTGTVTVNYPVGSYDSATAYTIVAQGPDGLYWDYDFTQPQRVFTYGTLADNFTMYRPNIANNTYLSSIDCNFVPSLTSEAWITLSYDNAQKRLNIDFAANAGATDRSAVVTMSDPYYPEQAFSLNTRQFRTEAGGKYYVLAYGLHDKYYLLGEYDYRRQQFSSVEVTLDGNGKIVETSELTSGRVLTITKTANGYTIQKYLGTEEIGEGYEGDHYLQAGSIGGFSNLEYRKLPVTKVLGAECYWGINWRNQYSNTYFTDIYNEHTGSDSEYGSLLCMEPNADPCYFGFVETGYTAATWSETHRWDPYAHMYWTGLRTVLYPAE